MTKLKKLSDELDKYSDVEVIQFFQAFLNTRHPIPEESHTTDGKYFLGMATKLRDDSIWGISVIGKIDDEHYSDSTGPLDIGFSQTGHCKTCNVGVSCNVKNVLCPICDSKVYLT